jgi:hypothetical protein
MKAGKKPLFLEWYLFREHQTAQFQEPKSSQA